MAATATDNDKSRLVGHVLEQVLAGLSGRDHEDLVDVVPERTIFAGVLAPLREGTFSATSTPDGTSLGLDFRVRVPAGAETFGLRISPRWSVYHPVFPTWEQVRSANDLGVDESASDDPEPDADREDDPEADDLAEGEDSLPDILADADEVPEALATGGTSPATVPPPASSPQDVILPRVWTRKDAECQSFRVTAPTTRRFVDAVGVAELLAAMRELRSAVSGDPRTWRHIGTPRERRRDLTASDALDSRTRYTAALQSVIGNVAAPPDWGLAIQVEVLPEANAPGIVRVRVLLANTTAAFDSVRDQGDVDPLLQARAIFDAGLVVEIDGATLVPFDFLLAPKDYRSNPEMQGKGVNCVASVDPQTPSVIRTETLPVFRQPLYRTRDELQVPFGSLSTGDPATQLDGIAIKMDEYLRRWDDFLLSPPARFTPPELDACRADRARFSEEIARYRLGVASLRRDARLAEAFRLMNATFAELGRKSGGRISAWRLFQIGFIVSQLPALAVRETDMVAPDPHALALRETMNDVGVLWFPTGGGKTEAYLGLIGTALLYDRLRGKDRGVTAWMRFPLRMLSLQQLERLSRVIAELNLTRANVPTLLLGDPFTVGYFVGDANSPNAMDKKRMGRYASSDATRERGRLLRKCPFCDSGVDVQTDEGSWRLKHVCSNATCFSNTSDTLGALKGSLPLLIVDTEIYRYMPSVLLGTVDKLAIAGRQKYFAHLVRGANQKCPVHGYASYDECVESAPWSAECKLTKSKLLKLTPVMDPGPSLLIQDELHLLRDELGVFNGHYEGLLQYLGARAYLPPKVLAATATIEAYDIQAFHIYLSRASRFPEPSWEQGESFYATSKLEQFRRTYVGILGHTRAIEEGALRALALYQREIRRLARDPDRAALIMGRPDLSATEVLDLLHLYDLSLAYVNRKSVAGSIEEKVPTHIDRVLAPESLGTVSASRLTGDQGLDQVGATLERIEAERHESAGPRLDLVAATNLISHGVDLERLNMLTVCGMPSHYAEYVQASSRAARSHPGLVFVLFRGRDPRESSQFEFFSVMHEHMDRLIEPVAVNRFASNAPEKTVPGLLSGLLLHDLSPRLFAEHKIARALDHVPTLRTAIGDRPANTQGGMAQCIDLADLLLALVEVIGVDRPRPPASSSQVDNVRAKVEEVFEDQIGLIRRTMENQLAAVLPVLSSFRDIDEGIEFASLHSASLVDQLS